MAGTPTNEEVLSRHVAWESYKTSGQISDADYRVIKRLDKSTETAMATALADVRPCPVLAVCPLTRPYEG